jgi:hypothetical protein
VVASCVGIQKHFLGAKIPDLICQTGSLAQVQHVSPETVLVNFQLNTLDLITLITILLLRIEPQACGLPVRIANLEATQAIQITSTMLV